MNVLRTIIFGYVFTAAIMMVRELYYTYYYTLLDEVLNVKLGCLFV